MIVGFDSMLNPCLLGPSYKLDRKTLGLTTHLTRIPLDSAHSWVQPGAELGLFVRGGQK